MKMYTFDLKEKMNQMIQLLIVKIQIINIKFSMQLVKNIPIEKIV